VLTGLKNNYISLYVCDLPENKLIKELNFVKVKVFLCRDNFDFFWQQFRDFFSFLHSREQASGVPAL
jgi:hypothetical protein